MDEVNQADQELGNQVASRYNITIPLRQGRRLVFNSLTMALAVWEAEDVAGFEKICAGEQAEVAPERIKDLRFGGFIVDEELDQVEALHKMYVQHRFNAAHVILTIAPTLGCNFKCDYCFQGQDKEFTTMGEDVQDAIVAMVERAVSRGVKILGVAWYGGEPLLEKEVIESLSRRIDAACKKGGAKFSASIVTNGYNLDLEMARFLQRWGVNWAQITLDGTAEYHDIRRPLLGGQGSFERIVENLKAIVDEVSITFAIRINIDDRNRDDIRALIEYLAEQGLGHRKNLKLYFAPIEAMTEGCHVIQSITMGKTPYSELEASLYQYGYKAGLTALQFPPRFHGVCAAVRPSSFVILPNGDIHKCWDTVATPERKNGTIFELDELRESELLRQWIKWTPFENSTCRDCKILPNCAGACGYKFIHSEATRSEAAVMPCLSWKYNIKERLLFRAVTMGKISTEDYDPAEIRTDPDELCAADVFAGQPAPPAGSLEEDEQAT